MGEAPELSQRSATSLKGQCCTGPGPGPITVSFLVACLMFLFPLQLCQSLTSNECFQMLFVPLAFAEFILSSLSPPEIKDVPCGQTVSAEINQRSVAHNADSDSLSTAAA